MIKENFEFVLNLAEVSNRYEDIRLHLKNHKQIEFSLFERKSFYDSYKKIYNFRRNLWHPIYILEKKDLENKNIISWYRQKLESEMEEISKEVFEILECQEKFSKNNEIKAFYLKMKGDYYRYQSEYHIIQENKEKYGVFSVQNAFDSYESASGIVLSDLPTTHPLRLSLALNFSVFFYEIMKSPDRAINIAKTAYKEGLKDLRTLEIQSKKETENLLTLINENITLWS